MNIFKTFFLKTIIICFCAFLYGVRHIYLEVEENACRMTYMFGIPQFSKVNTENSRQFTHYGLYYYYEGTLQKDVNNLVLKGAPVIFVPGNAGSYKQVRSLASVALRKGFDNERGIHLDYFTINYEEQLSGLYGGYLENQKQFLCQCILAVINLYKKSNLQKHVILIGHSMGGKVAQAVLEELYIASYVNTIITISTPLDTPVINFDYKMNQFYTDSDRYISTKRISYVPDIDTNVCGSRNHRMPKNKNENNETNLLDNILMISIGGGNRDLLVRDGLTTSKYSDIHAMTSSIPKVWLSCDHLSAVWCLQLMLVINRFIFAISNIDKNKNVFFNEDKSRRTQEATNSFVKPLKKYKSKDFFLPKSNFNDTWHEDSKLVYRQFFKNGLRSDYNQMLPLSKYKYYKKLYVEINTFDEITDWIYGCIAANFSHGIKCDKGTSLSHNLQSIASHDNIRSMVLLDLQHISKFYPQWTHILVRLHSTNKPVTLKLDAYIKKERSINIKMPGWFYLKEQLLIDKTVYGNIHYEVFIEVLEEPFPTLQFSIEPTDCDGREFYVTAKICIPWARGFERYSHITQLSKDKSVYVNVPTSAPKHYNSSENPVLLELFLDPVCRYKISYKFSIAGTMSKIVQEFYHWIPAHLTAVLFVVLRKQIVKFESAGIAVLVKPYAGYFQCTSLYVITGCRIIKKLLLSLKFLPAIDTTEYSIYVSIIIHSTSIVASIILVFITWTILTCLGNILLKIALRITTISVASSNIVVQVISALPLTFGVLFISVAFGTCSGIALALAACFYFNLLSNAYKDYLENWAFDKVTRAFRKLRTSSHENQHFSSDNRLEPATENTLGQDSASQNCDDVKGLEHFPFHITMLLLLIMMSVLNVGVSIAWIKSHYWGHIGEQLPDPFLVPAICVISSLSILLQFDAPNKSSGYRVVAILLYFCACLCIIYCQENIYILNYLIAFIYVTVALQEVIKRLLHCTGIHY